MGNHASADVAFGFNLGGDEYGWTDEVYEKLLSVSDDDEDAEIEYSEVLETKIKELNNNRHPDLPELAILIHGYGYDSYAVVIKESVAGTYEPGDFETFEPVSELDQDMWRSYLFGIADELGINQANIWPSYFVVSSYG